MQDNEKNQDDAERSTPSAMSDIEGDGASAESCQHKPIKMTAVLLFGEREHADTGEGK